MIVRSNKENAKPFRRWITHEVLPTIRKTGSYTVDFEEEEEKVLQLPKRMTPEFINSITRLFGKAAAQKIIAPYLGIALQEEQKRLVTSYVTVASEEVEDFVSSRIKRQKGFITVDEIYQEYAAYCAVNDYEPLAKVNFGKEFKAATGLEAKVVKIRGVATRGYEGIAIAQLTIDAIES